MLKFQMEVVAMFGESAFCMEFGNDMDMCMEGLELVIPTAMQVLGKNGHDHAQRFCTEHMHCEHGEQGLF